MGRAQKLAYDIGVNTVANLIAAAIIYLLGAWFGLLPREPAAIIAAIALLVSGLAVFGLVALTIRAVRRSQDGRPVRSERLMGGLTLVIGICCFIAAALIEAGAARVVALTVTGLGTFTGALLFINLPERAARRYLRRVRRARQNIERQLSENRPAEAMARLEEPPQPTS